MLIVKTKRNDYKQYDADQDDHLSGTSDCIIAFMFHYDENQTSSSQKPDC